MAVAIKFLVKLPTVAGSDLMFPTRKLAEREITNARKAGYDTSAAGIEEVMRRRF